MRIAYFDCMSGISGDMTLGALVDVGVHLSTLQAGVDSLGLPSCRLVAEEVKKCGFRATKVTVEYDPEHTHRHLHHITDMIQASELSAAQKQLAIRIFTRLGEAEARVHGTSIQKVHFHEVGAVDSIADIVGAAIGLDMLGVDRVVCSPVPTGSGFVKIAHGRVSIPAPATAELLKQVPIAPSEIAAELTTPTGAAIVTTVAERFGCLPGMHAETIGYGAGTKDLEGQANVLRLFVGTMTADASDADQICVLETNLDDVSGEVIGYTTTQLLQAGALDVYTTAIHMKKNRPGVMLSVIADPHEVAKLERIVFAETGTLGIRRLNVDRHKLRRQAHTVVTAWGKIDGKAALLSDGQIAFAPEYESCRVRAAEAGVPLRRVYDAARQAFNADQIQMPGPEAP
jgi:uncharacterized protein (TIGR00299 family) protein